MQKLSPIDVKYFKLVIPNNIKKETEYEIQCNCPLCGDKKHRLHLYRPDEFDKALVHCFNAGCLLEEKHHSVLNFLKLTKPELVQAYKNETSKSILNNIKNNKSIESVLDTIEKNTNLKSNDVNTIPEFIMKQFIKCKDNPECLKYIKRRGMEPKDDWFFCTKDFFKYNDKTVYLKDYLIIPLYNNNLYAGFYSRNIYEKKFSTFLMPNQEKFWMSEPNLKYSDIQLITEGIFDALSTNLKSGAMISASLPKSVKDELLKDVIFAFDNDVTGIQKAIQTSKEGFKVFVPPEEMNELGFKDFNEMLIAGRSKEQITKMIQENTYSGIEATVRLKMKEL